MVKKGFVLTPHADYCLPGITRATVREKKSLSFGENFLYKPLISYKSFKVMELVVKENFILEERRISLSEFHTADEVLSAYK